MNGLQVHEKVSFRNARRLAAVTAQVLGLASFDLGIAASWLAVAVVTFLHWGCTFLKHTKRLRWKGGSILVAETFASPAKQCFADEIVSRRSHNRSFDDRDV